MYLSDDAIQLVGKSIASDVYRIIDACTNLWNWVLCKLSTMSTTKYDTKKYDEAYSEVKNLLDSSYEKND
jgi:hypothetical protein